MDCSFPNVSVVARFPLTFSVFELSSFFLFHSQGIFSSLIISSVIKDSTVMKVNPFTPSREVKWALTSPGSLIAQTAEWTLLLNILSIPGVSFLSASFPRVVRRTSCPSRVEEVD